MPPDPALRRLALSTLLAAFPGRTAPEWACALLADGLAGFALFGGNIADRRQLAALTTHLRSVRPELLVATDEEGGDVTRLAHRTGSPYPGNAALGAIGDPDLTRTVYAAIGADLAAAGINLDLAPTVDVNTADDNPVIGTRSFGASAPEVARHSAAAVTGLQSTGVAACAKHFPGHGATVTDSHLELPTVDAPLSTLRDRDLPPFAAAIAAGTRSIMTAHLRVPALTGDDPATFSRAALHSLLREEYAFQGTIVTDALEMRGARSAAFRSAGALPGPFAPDSSAPGPSAPAPSAPGASAPDPSASGGSVLGPSASGGSVLGPSASGGSASGGSAFGGSPTGGVGEGAVRALAAGADLLCLGARVDAELVEGVAAEIVAALTDGRLELRRLEDAAARTAALAAWTRRPATPDAADAGIGYAAARRAVRVEGSVAGLADPLVVQLVAGHSIAEGRVPWGLSPHLHDVEQVPVVAAETSAEQLAARAGARPIVVVGRRTHRTEATRKLIESLAARHTVTVVEMGWPSAWRPAGVRAFVTTYGAGHANGRAAAEALGLAP
ncbi:glycoside hydrolase family 3 N-terminal domain-containing protein [Pseudosporangium ferrugineum]|uniref:Beta-N-acetylhexosaminidase n=1 Tax=Pseudosporangium ferrugineum TaxID=439699 RepID=A0A2T0SD23_9ACTN|nr:glycoside hydrolase family 3 N-terminal domain-containing protein [Pseudosporangium ferrugineum]PRY31325.1 beta-N-acetylhexosaminidase [Pseudosporangium ferrugineum]